MRPHNQGLVCNGDSARAVEAKILEHTVELDGGDSSQTAQTRFATGWIVTGNPVAPADRRDPGSSQRSKSRTLRNVTSGPRTVQSRR